MRTPIQSVLGIAVILVGSGCGTAETPPPAQTAPEQASSVTAAAPPETGTLVDVTISGGTVAPTNAEATAIAGQPITLEVDSDTADSIHVHSVPEHVFEVEPRSGQRFEFTVDVPGKVDVELHELNRTIVTITVRPR